MKFHLTRMIHTFSVMLALWKLYMIKWHMALLEIAIRK